MIYPLWFSLYLRVGWKWEYRKLIIRWTCRHVNLSKSKVLGLVRSTSKIEGIRKGKKEGNNIKCHEKRHIAKRWYAAKKINCNRLRRLQNMGIGFIMMKNAIVKSNQQNLAMWIRWNFRTTVVPLKVTNNI